MKINRILVPTDFSGPAREATDHALELARLYGASIHLFHVIEDPIAYTPALGGYMPLSPAELDEFSASTLDEWLPPAETEGITIERSSTHGHPVTRILECAQDSGCDLIVMGTHGRGMVAHMLMGSVAERVVRKARCPVLTVHPQFAHEQAFDPPVAAVEG